MKIYSTTITAAVLTTLLLACSAMARDHHAMNGTWTLVPTKSDFAGQAVVQTGTVTIDDHQGIITVSRSFVYAGATETFFYSDMTDAEHNATWVLGSGPPRAREAEVDNRIVNVRSGARG